MGEPASHAPQPKARDELVHQEALRLVEAWIRGEREAVLRVEGSAAAYAGLMLGRLPGFEAHLVERLLEERFR